MDGFQQTTLIEIDQILRQRYPDTLPHYTEIRDGNHKICETRRVSTNKTHWIEVRNIFDNWLWYREMPREKIVEDPYWKQIPYYQLNETWGTTAEDKSEQGE